MTLHVYVISIVCKGQITECEGTAIGDCFKCLAFVHNLKINLFPIVTAHNDYVYICSLLMVKVNNTYCNALKDIVDVLSALQMQNIIIIKK